MSRQALKPEKHVRGDKYNKETFWSNVKLGEITDETLARILIAVFDGGNISLGWQKIMRNRKPVLEVAIASIPA
jgi:hypothetical protein